MAVTIELKPETEASLLVQATAHGLDLPQFIALVLENQVLPIPPSLSPSERAAVWRKPGTLPVSPLLSDEAINRASIYDARG